VSAPRTAPDLTGRVALVTGAGHGLGKSHAIELARKGARVAILDIDAAAGQDTTATIACAGGEALALTADVADRAAVEQAVARIGGEWGRLDIVVSNAGTIHSATGLLDTDDEDWRRTIDVHVGGCLNVTRACIPWLEQSPAGRIIIVGSMWGQRGDGHSYAYVAAKGALMAFARNLAAEFGRRGICVNTISPGSIRTRMAADYTDDDIAEDSKTIPLGRWADAVEISNLVVFLASDRSSYVTGQTIAINGGQVICGY
jgi:NAD(P)-dependent dehydrogenase (short-subunit alcohol dehydrogenase family)